jgi:mRNA interferase MazF
MILPPFQWQVVHAHFVPVRGSEQGGRRPALIVSLEHTNCVLAVVTVLPLTTYRHDGPIFANEVLLPAGVAGQPADSLVLAFQVRTVSKSRLERSYGWLTDEGLREQVRKAMMVHLDLD